MPELSQDEMDTLFNVLSEIKESVRVLQDEVSILKQSLKKLSCTNNKKVDNKNNF